MLINTVVNAQDVAVEEEEEDPFMDPDHVGRTVDAIMRRFAAGATVDTIMEDNIPFRNRCPGLFTKICEDPVNFDMQKLKYMLSLAKSVRTGGQTLVDANSTVAGDIAREYVPAELLK